MNRLRFLGLAIVSILTSTISCAKSGSPTKSPELPREARNMMNRASALMDTIRGFRDRAQHDMVSALSEEHLRLLSRLIGQVGVARIDVATATQDLDAALSDKEKKAIVDAASAYDANTTSAYNEDFQKFGQVWPGRAVTNTRGPGATLLLLTIGGLQTHLNMYRWQRNGGIHGQ
jgi:hypothetical protein